MTMKQAEIAAETAVVESGSRPCVVEDCPLVAVTLTHCPNAANEWPMWLPLCWYHALFESDDDHMDLSEAHCPACKGRLLETVTETVEEVTCGDGETYVQVNRLHRCSACNEECHEDWLIKQICDRDDERYALECAERDR